RPSAPGLSEPWPCPPRVALKCERRRKLSRSRSESSHTSTTSPPRPPSPPSGPPLGTWASRRKLVQPSPPAPARTSMRTWSIIQAPLSEPEAPHHAERPRLPDHRRFDGDRG